MLPQGVLFQQDLQIEDQLVLGVGEDLLEFVKGKVFPILVEQLIFGFVFVNGKSFLFNKVGQKLGEVGDV